jgi:1,4-dihydroxy-2-naphthoyl-CoA hydrolase
VPHKGNLPPVPDLPSGLLPLERSLDGLLGYEAGELGDERATASFTVQDHHRQPFGIVHGGVYSAVAEGLVSATTYLAVKDDGLMANGMSNASSFLRPVTAGTISVEARRRHRGRTTWVWDVDFTDEQGRLCATTRVTLAIRPMPEGR